MGSGDQILVPMGSIDSNNNPMSKPEESPAQGPIFNISPAESPQQSPPNSPEPTSDHVCHLPNPDEPFESFERFRSRSEGSMLRKPKKGCLLKKNSDLGHKLPRHVSFADARGMALAQVNVFDSQPHAITDFVDSDDGMDDCLLLAHRKFSAPALPRPQKIPNERRFVPYFTLAWNGSGKNKLLYATLEERKICLESISINSPWRITGTILVKNLSFHKRVFVRRTLDKWQSHKDTAAEYVCAVEPDVDRFRFDLRFAFKMSAGTRLELALGYEQGDTGAQHWDSNGGINYGFWYNDKI